MIDEAFSIVFLADAPSAAPMLADWFLSEWQPYYGTDGTGDATEDLAACMRRDALPLALVALDAEGRPLGTAALKTESAGSELGLSPWLAAVLVGPPHRGRGIGSALVTAIEGEARRLGHPMLYTSTDTMSGLLQRRGWRAINGTDTLRGRATIYRLELNA